jgi:hypothetical protein
VTTDPFRCICDPDNIFEPPDPKPVAVEGCPAHQARRAYQQFVLGMEHLAEAGRLARLAAGTEEG